MNTVLVTSNLEFTLDDADFEKGLRQALHDNPDVASLQEVLEANGRDGILSRVCKELGYAWARAKGGEPVLWKITRYGEKPRWVRPVRLARREFVGHLPGRKPRLPASICTEVGLDDLWRRHPDGAVTVIENYHLTAEIQDMHDPAHGYKKDLAHRLRVMRHKREKRRLGKRSRIHQRRGREVNPMGDGNFAGMQLGGFVNCWEGRHGGTLQGRAVDIVFADRKPTKLWTIQTPSDHDTLVVTYSDGS